MRTGYRQTSLVVMMALAGCTTGAPPTTVTGWAEIMDALDDDQQEMRARSDDVVACGEAPSSGELCVELVQAARAFGQRVGEVLPPGDPPEQIEPTVTETRRLVEEVATLADAYDEACSGGTSDACNDAFVDLFTPVLQLLRILDAYDRATETERSLEVGPT